MNRFLGAITIAGVIVIMVWSSLVAWVFSVFFLGSWIGYGLALSVNLPIGAVLGRYVTRRRDRFVRSWAEMP